MACCEGDCQPTLLMCGLPLTLPGCGRFAFVGGSSTGGGPYGFGCEVSDGLVGLPAPELYDCEVSDGEDRGLGCCSSLRRCGGTLMPPM